ncbi:MAG: ATP-binding protein [Longimicrobiales bacterium]
MHDSNSPAQPGRATDARARPDVKSSRLLDRPAEEFFDRLTQLASRLTGAAASFTSLVHAPPDISRSSYRFVRDQTGTGELDSTTFCRYSMARREPLVVPDTGRDTRFRRMPAIESHHVRAYLGVPLMNAEGVAVGSLCVVDFQPHDWTADQVETITELADIIRRELEFRTALRESEGLRQELERRSRESALNIAAGSALTAGGPLDRTLNVVAQAIVDHLDAAFARIWILNETDQMLELKASAGMYTHLDGPHSRVPMGALKIGKIAEEELPHLTNDVLNDPRISDHAWARRERMVAFAGYPLMVGTRVVGVMAMFARHTLGRDTLDAFESVADGVALAIEQGRTEQALVQRERQFETLADSIPQLAWMADGRGNIFWYNRRSSEYTGLTLDAIRASGWRDLCHPDERSRVDGGYRRAVETGEPWEDTFRVRSHSGEFGWFLGRAMPIRDESGMIVQWFGTLTDITEARRAEERLRQYADQTEKALELHDEVLAVVSHDLRNPLHTVFMAASLLLDLELPPEKQRAQFTSIRRAVMTMDRLIQDLLDVSRADAGTGLRLELREETIRPLLQEVVDSFALTAAQKKIQLSHETEADVPRVRVDRARLQQVLSNLIGNSHKFTRRGGRITLRLEPRPNELLFSVSDTGLGIAAQDIGYVFDRFWQAGTTKRAGAGLGLAICKAVVQAHGGRIWVESQEGKGSTFYFTLPTAT